MRRPKDRAAATGTLPALVRARPEVIAPGVRSLPIAPPVLPVETAETAPSARARIESPLAETVAAPSMPALVMRSTPTRAMAAPALAGAASARAAASVRLVARMLSWPPAVTVLLPASLANEVLPRRTVAVAASWAASVWPITPRAVAVPLTVEDETSEMPSRARRSASVTTTVAVELPCTAARSPVAVKVPSETAENISVPPETVAPVTVTEAEASRWPVSALSCARSAMSPLPVSTTDPGVRVTLRPVSTRWVPLSAHRSLPSTSTLPAPASKRAETSGAPKSITSWPSSPRTETSESSPPRARSAPSPFTLSMPEAASRTSSKSCTSKVTPSRTTSRAPPTER